MSPRIAVEMRHEIDCACVIDGRHVDISHPPEHDVMTNPALREARQRALSKGTGWSDNE
jgi:hypothetical protein